MTTFLSLEKQADHLAAPKEILARLRKAGLRLKNKCEFMQLSVKYLGYRIDAEGVHPVEEKVKAIQEAASPTNVAKLKSYLGLLSYYGRFLLHLLSVLAPLYKLLSQYPMALDIQGESLICQIEGAAYIFASSGTLRFRARTRTIMQCICLWDWRCIGAQDARWIRRPIGFAWRTLSEAEKNY